MDTNRPADKGPKQFGSGQLDLYGVREVVANRYLSGKGIEFGALHNALRVPDGARVRYADVASAETLHKMFPDIESIRPPDIISDIESMQGINDESEDFVIANHVLEHVEDPLQALKSINRVLRPSGVAFLSLPDKRFTFDKDRKLTSLEHLIKDHEDGPDWSLAEHYTEWCTFVDGLRGAAHEQKVALMLKERSNIHFHVWDFGSMMEMFSYVTKISDLQLDPELSLRNDIEVIWIFRKQLQRISVQKPSEPKNRRIHEALDLRLTKFSKKFKGFRWYNT
jgi:predicted SAM-dependent methyltransferase